MAFSREIVVKLLLVVVGLIPIFRLFYLGFADALSSNPVEFILRSTGTWALFFLCITLSLRPAIEIFNAPWLIKYRRTLSLIMFFYASCHFLIWFWIDQDFDLTSAVVDILNRPFLATGFLAFLMAVPLAITSNQFSIRLLKTKWAPLHKVVYLVAILSILHYFLHKAGKNDFQTVYIYAVWIFMLLVYRLLPKSLRSRAN